MRALLNSTLAVVVGIAVVSPASASVIATFDYFGSATFGGAPQTPDLNTFPAGGASNVAGSFEIDTSRFQGFSSRVGFGQVNPVLSYGAGAIAAGDVSKRDAGLGGNVRETQVHLLLNFFVIRRVFRGGHGRLFGSTSREHSEEGQEPAPE